MHILIGILLGVALFLSIAMLLYFLKRNVQKEPIWVSYTILNNIEILIDKNIKFLNIQDIENWIKETCDFWSLKEGWDITKIQESIKGTIIYFYNMDKILFGNEFFRGLTWIDTKIIKIASLSVSNQVKLDIDHIDYNKSLVRHEISHLIIWPFTYFDTNELAHDFFAKEGLGA